MSHTPFTQRIKTLTAGIHRLVFPTPRRHNKVTPITTTQESGSVAIEASISIGIFLIIVFNFIALATHLYHQVGLQFAVNDTARWASIGNVIMTADQRRVSGVVQRTADEVKTFLKDRSKEFGVLIDESQVTLHKVCTAPEIANATCNPLTEITAIEGSSVFRISASRPSTQLHGMMPLTLEASAIGLSERAIN